MKEVRHAHKKEYDLIVIGGGPAGMMAAGTAAKNGKRVLILEKNAVLGKKLSITGGGRCNITNATFDSHEFLKKFGPAGKFLHSPLSQFGVQDTFDFFTERNLPLVVEARKRAFPTTQKATDVTRVMTEYINHPNVTVLLKNAVRRINVTEDKSHIISVTAQKATYTADNYLIASGGASHPETGSTGDGFRWLDDIGHTTSEPTPKIVPLRIKDRWVRNLSGVSLSFMKITFYVSGKKAFSEKGKVLFTHFGISGPLILNLAHKVSDLLHEGEVTATIDCYPDTDLGSLEKNILKTFDAYKNKSFKNVIKDIVPVGLADVILDFKEIPDGEEKVHSISRDARKNISRLLKALPLTVDRLMGLDRAVISDGGVPLEEVDTRTMKSRRIDNLYLTGDILNINRPSGGYGLQLCWTTGYVAGLLK